MQNYKQNVIIERKSRRKYGYFLKTLIDNKLSILCNFHQRKAQIIIYKML